MDILRHNVLVLNKNWFPIGVENIIYSIGKVFGETANIVDESSFNVYSWDQWLKKFSYYKDEDCPEQYEYISTTRKKIRIPVVVVLCGYDKIPKIEIHLTRKNLLIRDRYSCQYTNKKVRANNATIDHVTPRSKGGKHVWENVVICSREANSKKGDRTPEQAGMKLLRTPRKPAWNPVFLSKMTKNVSQAWEKFMSEDMAKNIFGTDNDI